MAPPEGGAMFVALASNRNDAPLGQRAKGGRGDFDFPPLGPLDSLSPLETTRGQAPEPSLTRNNGMTLVVGTFTWVEG